MRCGKKTEDSRGYLAAVIALTGRFWGVQGGGTSPLVEAPKAPDRRALHRRYSSQVSERVRLDVYRLTAHCVCCLGDRLAQGRMRADDVQHLFARRFEPQKRGSVRDQ